MIAAPAGGGKTCRQTGLWKRRRNCWDGWDKRDGGPRPQRATGQRSLASVPFPKTEPGQSRTGSPETGTGRLLRARAGKACVASYVASRTGRTASNPVPGDACGHSQTGFRIQFEFCLSQSSMQTAPVGRRAFFRVHGVTSHRARPNVVVSFGAIWCDPQPAGYGFDAGFPASVQTTDPARHVSRRPTIFARHPEAE